MFNNDQFFSKINFIKDEYYDYGYCTEQQLGIQEKIKEYIK